MLEELGKLFQYQGMDPIRILKRFASLGKGRNWMKDAVFLISLHICRGTKIEKIAKSVLPEAKKEIDDLASIYQITESKPEPEDITLARLALCFPLFTCRQLANFEEQLTVKPHQMHDISPDYPVAMMHPAFASLICSPGGREQDVTDLMDAHRLYLVELTKVINPSMRSKPISEIVKSFEQPLQAGYSSTFTSPANRRASLEKLELVSKEGTLAKAVVDAAHVYRQKTGQ